MSYQDSRGGEEVDYYSDSHGSPGGSTPGISNNSRLGPGMQRNRDQQMRQYNDLLERQGIPALSPEDIAILRECGRESLLYRCLPITAALCAGMVYTARVKQWSPRFYHYLGAVFIGYFTGKLSYRSSCEDKLINSRSNSPFVNAIRKRRGLFVEEFRQGEMASPDSLESDWTTASSDTKSYGMHEFDHDDREFHFTPPNRSRGPFENRDEFDLTGDTSSSEMPSSRSGITYDDLRARNRSSFKNI